MIITGKARVSVRCKVVITDGVYLKLYKRSKCDQLHFQKGTMHTYKTLLFLYNYSCGHGTHDD